MAWVVIQRGNEPKETRGTIAKEESLIVWRDTLG